MFLLFAVALMTQDAQETNLSGKSDVQIEKVAFDPAKWELAWQDEFDKGTAPDPKYWGYEEGYLRNNEAQYYTKDRRENARIEGGKLVIEARKDDWQGKPITSAAIETYGKKDFLYGRIEVRAKLPTGKGTWPAIWMLGSDIGKTGWPACGEIDIMENVGFDPNRTHANIHVKKYNHMNGNGRGNNMIVPDLPKDFHIYALEWTKDKMDFFFDDTRYFTYKNEGTGVDAWPFDKPQYLILNLAIGGTWGGQQGVDEALFPHRFEVDYVRYYKPKS